MPKAQSEPALPQVLEALHRIRNIKLSTSIYHDHPDLTSLPLLQQLPRVSQILTVAQYEREAQAIESVHSLSTQSTDFGGLGFKADQELNLQAEAQVFFLISAWLESLNSEDRAKKTPDTLTARPEGRRGMTLSEKILAAHDIERRGELKPGDLVRVDVDWIMASELSWGGMKKQYDALGKPGIFRNDRFWLAGDHVVDPRVKDEPLIKQLVADSEAAKRDFMMTEYQGMNYTIMHTEFFRERAQPGMLIIGSDSHTCSSGALGCLAIGLGVADVTVPLITGETWFKVPESVNIRLVGKPSPGIGGKDTILYIMKELKRNTVAAERIIEFTGPGVEYLSCDARFAISNMTTEFGGITGVFSPDHITRDFVNQRKAPRNKKNSRYFCADEDAVYVETHIIDLSKVETFVARYPSPDDVVPINVVEGTHLDGCFIGACTTAEEDLILGAMVLELGLKRGQRPVKNGKRKVVPGSLPILHRLKELGLDKIYEEAGFEVGIPGCSYCVGMSADKAAKGEVWLSSQNRNFENRMGKGSIGSLASAVSVAASSFDMQITDPRPLLDELDLDRLEVVLGRRSKVTTKMTPTYEEPSGFKIPVDAASVQASSRNSPSSTIDLPPKDEASDPSRTNDVIRGRVHTLGDFIDTDALAPADALLACKTNEEIGQHCLKYTHPTFRSRVKNGSNIVVAGTAFGCGSSRENAVSALIGAGVKCVIAKSFGFIYARNQPNLGLLGLNISDPKFYEAAVDDAEIEIDLTARKITVGDEEWGFELSQMERELIKAGGMDRAFKKFGKRLFEAMCAPVGSTKKQDIGCETSTGLQW